MRRSSILTPLLLLAVAISGCNIFESSYSEEENTDIPTVLAGAEAAFRNHDFSKAIALYSHALALNPENNYPRFRKLQSLMLRNCGDTPLLHLHSPLFATPGAGTDPLYNNYSQIDAANLLADSAQAYKLLPYKESAQGGFWSSLSQGNSAVLNDSALACTVYGLLLLQDGNDNGIPLENSDPGKMLDNFSYDAPTGLTQTETSNLTLLLANATNAFARALEFLNSKSDLSSIWQYLKNNLNASILSVSTSITSLETL